MQTKIPFIIAFLALPTPFTRENPHEERVASEREYQGIKILTDYAQKTGKPVIGVVVSKDSK